MFRCYEVIWLGPRTRSVNITKISLKWAREECWNQNLQWAIRNSNHFWHTILHHLLQGLSEDYVHFHKCRVCVCNPLGDNTPLIIVVGLFDMCHTINFTTRGLRIVTLIDLPMESISRKLQKLLYAHIVCTSLHRNLDMSRCPPKPVSTKYSHSDTRGLNCTLVLVSAISFECYMLYVHDKSVRDW